MRFHGVAICTLTVLLTGGLTAQASDNLSSKGSVQEPVLPEASVAPPTVTARGIEAIASPEKLEEQKFLEPAATDSKPESRLEPSSSAQNTQALPERQIGTLGSATPQTQLSDSPKAEAPRPDNIVAELANPKVNPPTSEQSPLVTLSKAEALRPNQVVAQPLNTNVSQPIAQAQPEADASCTQASTPEPVNGSAAYLVAQGSTTPRRCPRPQPIAPLVVPAPVAEFESSPALSIYIPVGYGADNNTVFLTGSYQASVRRDEGSVGAGGIGIGLGDAQKAVGLELSYAFETTDDPFGQGGFNAKLHRRLGQDLSAAVGWNGFLNIGRNDFEQSKYGVITKVFRTQESLNSPFSRVALTVGVGDGQFRSNGAVDAGDNNVNVFGNVAIRVARPVSFIAEWTGQDLGLGLSIAPFRNFPLVITPAVRDIVGGGDEPRFVIGAGTAIRF